MKTHQIIYLIIGIIVLLMIMINNTSDNITDTERKYCMEQTGNIYCNGPRGD